MGVWLCGMKIMRRLLSSLVAFLGLGFFGLAGTATAQAQTLDWPSGGTFTVGEANWAFDEYGLAAAWDDADNYYDDGYGYYPNLFSFSHDPDDGTGGDYFLCGDPNSFPNEVIVTELSSGSINILCPEVVVPGYSNLTAQLEFLLYPESSSGYLVRQTVAVTNSSSVYEVIPDLQVHNYSNLHTDYPQGQYAGHEEAEWFIDSINSPFVGWLWEDATFYSQGMGDGRAVSLTQAWAKTGTAPESRYFTDNSNNQGNPYAGSGTILRTNAPNYFGPKETTTFLTFTNMVIPSAVSPTAGAAAKTTAIAQTTEFATFTGRLIESLPDCTTYAGWGTTPGDCELATGVPQPEQNNQICPASLAKTGFEPSALLVGGFGALMLGTSLLILKKNWFRAIDYLKLKRED